MIRWPPLPTIMSPGVVELKGPVLSPLSSHARHRYWIYVLATLIGQDRQL
jgi:hypothetical protein